MQCTLNIIDPLATHGIARASFLTQDRGPGYEGVYDTVSRNEQGEMAQLFCDKRLPGVIDRITPSLLRCAMVPALPFKKNQPNIPAQRAVA